MREQKPLTGRESSILSQLAQNRRHMSKRQIDKALLNLDGDALKIGGAIVGRNKNHPEPIKAAAQDFIEWAKGLGHKNR